MTYRQTSDAADAPVEILLVTSRETKRWVLPKGNPIRGLEAHAAAAHEAEEEAGVRGSVCPSPIGSYTYRKKKRTGASLLTAVDVYPFLVTAELDEWPEMHERERRWFPLGEAAPAVEEEDLQILLRNFSAGDVAARGFIATSARDYKKGTGMFNWFQALLPKQGNFFEMFEAHAATLNAASNALARLLEGGPGMADHIKEIEQREHDADDIIREVLRTVRRTFLTPFDRGAIIELINAMDDAIDQMQQTAGAIDLYEIKEFDQGMRDMAAIIVDASRLTGEALPLLRDIPANGARLHTLTERLVHLEGQADKIHAAGLRSLFHQYGKTDTLKFIVLRELYSHLERVVDSYEDVANEIDGLVIDHS